ncbi:MAG: serine hydrolase [Planctomycetota bacterium]
MSQRAALFLPIAPLCLSGLSLAIHPPEEGDDVEAAHIARIESALVPSFVIEGEAPRRATLEQRMRELGVPGLSVAVFRGGEIAWTKAWGQADVERRRAVTPRTLFQAASISKPLAAMAALRMVDEGALWLDEDVNEALYSWQVPAHDFGSNPVTLRRLLNHTAGLNVGPVGGYDIGDELPDVAQMLSGDAKIDAVEVVARPGSEFRYSGGGYTVLQQLLVDQDDRRSFPDLLRESVLEPLGMQDSTYAQPLPKRQRALAATGYFDAGRPIKGGSRVYPALAAAGLWTTPTDLARYAISVHRARAGDEHPVLSPSMIEEMLTPGLNEWGLGPEVRAGDNLFQHGGSNDGFRCQLTLLLEQGDGLAIMSNSDQASPLLWEFLLTVAKEYGWSGFEQVRKQVVPLEPEAYRRLEGVYTVEGWGSARVVHRDGGLWAERSWDDTVEILPESPTSFFARDDAQSVEFELEDGRVVAAWFSGWRFERTASASPQTDEAESEAANEAAYLGEPAVGLTPEIFAPDVLSLEDRYEYGIAISADGLQIYFGVAGDERAEIRSVEYAEGEWSTDRPVLPDATFSFNDPFLSSDQKRLYFISDAALTGEGRKQDHDIWYVERREKGWSDLIHGGAELNTSFEEYFVSLTDDGTLYFASNRPKPPADSWGGGFDLYASPSADGSFQSAKRLPAALNTEHYEADVFVAPDESYVIFCATRPDGLGRGDLYISFRGSDGEWSTAKSMGDAINTDSHELCPFVSRDGRFFFYTSNEDIYWVDARVLESFR